MAKPIMVKTKRRGRRDTQAKTTADTAQKETKRDKPAPPQANPPRPNRPMLILSGTLLLAWLIFLLCVALIG